MAATEVRSQPVPRIQHLRVQNYRALHDCRFRGLTPLTVLLGPNGSGKSTVFDVFAFLAECFSEGLRGAWDKRGRFKELRTRGANGPIVIELSYREEPPKPPLITYHLEIDEEQGTAPIVSTEWLRWTRKKGKAGRPFNFLDFHKGEGMVISGEMPDEDDERIREKLDAPD
ncbi:MAG: AAA family ATPase, partial [bacterium]